MTSIADLPTPITPDPADLPPESDSGKPDPSSQDIVIVPVARAAFRPERASQHFTAHRSFMLAATFRWPKTSRMMLAVPR